MNANRSLCCVLPLLANFLPAQEAPIPPDVRPLIDHVVHGPPGEDVPWATGRGWKASFGRDGFTFVPFFGAEAPRNFPVHFGLTEVRVGGRPLPIDRSVAAAQSGDRFVYDRGAVAERYDLSLEHVEQSFVVTTDEVGDIEVELTVTTDLRENAAEPGLQFGNELGRVDYGTAFVVREGDRLPIETRWNGRSIVLRVAMHQRGAGPVVIDPVVAATAANYGGFDTHQYPDLAYDATNGVWLLVWESVYSVTDLDIYSQMFDRYGNRVPASGRAIDNSTQFAQRARVANRNDLDQFFIVHERSDPAIAQGRRQIYGQIRPALAGGLLTPRQMISSGTGFYQCRDADVGGDPGPSGGPTWPVVWNEGTGEIWHRRVNANGTPIGSATRIVHTQHPIAHMRISDSNGRGVVPNPMWLVVFDVGTTRPDHDIAGVAIPLSGPAHAPYTIEHTVADDLYPSVANPFAVGFETRFVLTCERQSPASAIAMVYSPANTNLVSKTDLSSVGIGPFWVRVQTDGLRYAFTSSTDGSTISLTTLLRSDSPPLWQWQGGPHALPGAPSFPTLASIGGAGGGLTEYAVAYVDGALPPGRTTFGRYDGHSDGSLITFATSGCDGLQLSWIDVPLLGNTIGFILSEIGQGLPVFVLGAPQPNPVTLCAPCAIGVQLDLPTQLWAGQTQIDIAIPALPSLVGQTWAVQGATLGAGTCLGSLSFSDTIWFTVR